MKTTAKRISSSRVLKPLLQTLILLIGIYFAAGMVNVQAQTVSSCASHGNLIYEGKRGDAALYAADIRLLEEKISAIPERCFDPVSYARTHSWESDTIFYEEKPCPGEPETGDAPEAHREPEIEDAPEAPDEPEVEGTPEETDEPEAEGTPEETDEPETEDTPEEPENEEPLETEDVPDFYNMRVDQYDIT